MNPKLFAQSLFGCFCILIMASFIHAHEWMAPKEAASLSNPIASDQESIARGKKLFLNNCAYCHGEDAQGMTADEAGLDTIPPNLKQRLANHTDGDFFWKIQNGRGEMPAFQESLSEEEIWHVINFIKSR